MFARQPLRFAQPLKQGFRKYSTEAPAKGKSSLAPIYISVGLAGLGVGLYRYSTASAETPVVDRPKVFTGGEQGWVDLKLSEIENLSHNTKRLRFEFADKEAVSGLQVASALLTKFKPAEGKPVIRPYTPVSDEDQPGYLDLVVKVYPNGPMSEHLHSMNVDQRLEFKGPIPKYPWETNKHKHICLIAGGTGITPMYQLARQIFKNPEDQTKVTLVFGNVSEEDILLKKELQELENTHPRRFKAFYVLDNPPKEWTGGKGYVTKELLKTVLPEPKEEDIKIFVCGPPGMYKAISGPKVSPKDQGELTGLLAELGYNKDQVYKF
ncbi:cytochrome b5 reductase family protein [Aspergillus clavatus NRRL 1]|uniref:NADH-cytochrome b5 reductase 2 n=1 Tax=Aspergillus clavatus (strain ATCC 1007 / CBS 513.65 / DSM 816 / NCTC 3887 / NRRL 1 / QM 1276 / 107) TaxID=344612 RepID=MCR1_ASPCL|nr:NADH-cytochrome b5 reductase, putative [Aspergillus clavatus NRRL 1]A1CRK9.1 RecName: Full=NADH-cytochrome b5 reductase 2; AltName: Full=Mitochondrial cytochrome b reductase [Aspergillus clavatus NRRL 1]EAW08280.1 NADH-cytochrome b5 reductase, putative [Aspergillus clavatus NRRL 1]